MGSGALAEAVPAAGTVPVADTRARSLVRSSGVYAVANLLQRGLTFILLPLYARHFSRAEFGAMEQLYQGVMVLSLLTSCGLPQGLVRGFYLDNKTDEDRRRLLGVLVALLLPVTLITAGATFLWREPLTRALFVGEGQTSWLALSTLFYVALTLQQLPLQLFRTRQEPVRYAAWSLAAFLITAGTNVYFIVYLGWGLSGMLLGNILGFGLTAIALVPALVRSLDWNTEWGRLRPLFAFGLPMLPALLGRKVLEIADRYMIPVYHGLDTLGGYVMAAKVANILDVLLLVPFLYAWQPFFYSFANRDDAGPVFARVTHGFTTLLITVLLTLAAVRDELLRVLGGGRYQDAGPLVQVLVLAVLFNGVQYCISPGIHLRRKLMQETGLMLLAAVVNMALNVVLIPTYAAWGAAVATAVAYFFYLVATFVLSQRCYHIDYPWGRLSLIVTLALVAAFAIETVPGLGAKCGVLLAFIVLGPLRDFWVHGELKWISDMRRGSRA